MSSDMRSVPDLKIPYATKTNLTEW